ncbi:DUF1997 domain-containing protein [Synechococcales cyanobacterium C]|uniref:DUF1997 domain-containing protein n=1 Tax=Petrachloros mirabilis ULC683 TaxID=2781853 RepID=A0A8K2A7I2_9CYAN|nr:DUF1997 domain-containing protein [Petrachloros mirabilis]NCJ05990.1 DUF1997 domain-containing protein [Petrachloros mirabilis ULC683]
MQTNFTASQSVVIQVPEEVVPIQHYLRQPRRLIHALTDPSRVEQLSNQCFRLKMRSLHFLMLKLQPTVDMKVWATPDGIVHIESVGCEIRGVDYINQRFQLQLQGQLYPAHRGQKTQLEGRADLKVSVELPPMFWMTPRPVIEATGNGLLKSVLLSVKQRLVHQLITDYRHWVKLAIHSPRPQGYAPEGTTPLAISGVSSNPDA